MRRTTALIICLCIGLAVAFPAISAQKRTEESVVRIVNFSQRGEWFTPWDVTGVAEASGSGFVIEGGLVLTNAHVVSDSRYILMQAHNDPEQYVAEVVHIAHDCDLALIRPVEPEVLSKLPALRFGNLPLLGSAVDTLGYPAGGTQVSSTRGVVSRIEDRAYVHSGKDSHLVLQTDAAINPGNSGGPVVQEGKVVGVAFQVNTELENVGHVIPVEVIKRFLHDVEDGRYDGYPELGMQTSGMDNPAARAQIGMEENETGVRVNLVHHGGSAEGHVLPGDIILAVDGNQVANDGTVADGNGRMQFGLLIDRRQIAETVPIRVLRDGTRLEIQIPLRDWSAMDTQGHYYDQKPRYYVYGGLVFIPLSREMLKTYGSNWRYEANQRLLHEHFMRSYVEPESILHERVVLLRRLKHRVNKNMTWYRNEVVERVNGRKIRSLDDLVETLENHSGDYHFIEFAHHRRVAVLDRREAEATHQEILELYGIKEDRNL